MQNSNLVTHKYEILCTDGTRETAEVLWRKKPTYDQLVSVTKQYFPWWARVRVRYNGVVTDMFVDEEGLLKHLPVNPWNRDLDLYPGLIVGPALLFHRPVIF